MADFVEATIKTFSGLSSETKPTIAAGNNVPNGSRWREVDTLKTYTFNLSTDAWYASSPEVDTSTHATTVIAYAHHEVHSGSSFAMHVANANLAKDGEINIVFTTPAGAKWFHCEAMVGAANAGLFSIEQAAVTSGGTAHVPRNRNQNSIKASTAITPVINATYTSSTLQLHVEAVGAGKGGTSGGSRGADEYILLANTKYCFRYVGANTATASGPVSIEVTWYEHTDKA